MLLASFGPSVESTREELCSNIVVRRRASFAAASETSPPGCLVLLPNSSETVAFTAGEANADVATRFGRGVSPRSPRFMYIGRRWPDDEARSFTFPCSRGECLGYRRSSEVVALSFLCSVFGLGKYGGEMARGAVFMFRAIHQSTSIHPEFLEINGACSNHF